MNSQTWVARLGPAYIVWMMIVTRLCGVVGGALVVYYVGMTLEMSEPLQRHWNFVAASVVLLSVTATVLLALWETPNLRAVMRLLHLGRPFPAALGREAGREAVVFPIRHHLREAFVVPLCCLPPVYAYLTWIAGAELIVLIHITIATFMGVASAVSVAYFVIMRLMHPVVRHLMDYGVVIDYENLPTSRLYNQLLFSFTLTILITAMMIGTLATQKASNLVNSDVEPEEVVSSLRIQTIAISACAVMMALLLSTFVARSVSIPVQDMVRAMRRVEAGKLTERITAISTNEIGILGRSFNRMVQRLEENQQSIQDLNASLERKVRERTHQLEESKHKLEESYRQLKENDRLKTEFFSNVSHELRTPLTLILTPVETMIEGSLGQVSDDQKQVLRIVHRNTLRLLELINDLLDFAKLKAGKATLNTVATDVNDMIDELVSSAAPLAEQRGVRLSFEPDRALPIVMIDREKLESVVTNLLSNALKFTPADGRVDVRTGRAEGELTISVKDNGIGIAPQNHNKIYERFVQIDGSTSRQFQGTGLGLPLTAELVERHGGRIVLDSDLGRGSCFTVALPLVPPSDQVQRTPFRAQSTNYATLLSTEDENLPVPRGAEPSTDQTILVVDDSQDVVRVLRTVLETEYRVVEANNGETGLELAGESQPDLIIADVMMPRMDGYEFCAHIKANPRTARIPFIMLTAKANLSMKIEGLEQGADDFLIKPFNPRELRARVRSLLNVRKLDRQLQVRNEELEVLLDELKRTQDRLVQSEKMTSLGELVAGIAHEINNSINAVHNGILPLREKIASLKDAVCSGMSESDEAPIVSAEVRDDLAFVLELAEVVESGAKRTADIVSDLKKFAHPGQDKLSLFDVHEGLEIALNLLSNKLKNRVRVQCDFCDDGSILCAGAQLSQVFLNVLDNAQHSIEGAGTVFIRTERTSDHLIVRIRDEGAGVPADIQGRIFDPFFTTKEVGVGTGLGLSISYGIVKGHGGTIELTSPPPGEARGAEFTISLPVAPDADGADDGPRRERSDSSNRALAATDAPALPERISR